MLGYRKLIENPKRYKAKQSDIHKLQKLPFTDELQSFTSAKVAADINKAKPSKALDTDGILMLMLKKFGERGVEFLIIVFNLSLRSLPVLNA